MIAKLALGLGAVAIGVAVVALRCRLGLHSWGWQFVGDSWNPDLYVRACSRCGIEHPKGSAR